MEGPEIEELAFAVESRSAGDADRLVIDAGEFADRIRREIGDLVAKRNAVLEAASLEAAEFRREAVEEAEAMLAEAQRRFESIVASAEVQAATILGEARAEVAHLNQVKDRYMSTLEVALENFRRLPEPS